LGELIERALILEEDDLAETLAADLEPDVHLCHGHIADVDPLPEHAASAVRTADDETALADAGEDGIAVALLKECSAGSGFLEDPDGFVVVVRPARRGAKQHHSPGDKRKVPLHHRSPYHISRFVIPSAGSALLWIVRRTRLRGRWHLRRDRRRLRLQCGT